MLHLFHNGADMADRFDNIAGAGFALGPDHGCALADPAQRFAQVARAADEWNFEVTLVDVVFLVGRRQDFAFVDVIYFERFQNAGFGEVTDAGFGHHRDADGSHDFTNLADGGHAGHTTVSADIGRNTLQSHDRGRSRLFGDYSPIAAYH